MQESHYANEIERTTLEPASSYHLEYFQGQNSNSESQSTNFTKPSIRNSFYVNFILVSTARMIFHCKNFWEKNLKLDNFNKPENKYRETKFVDNALCIAKKSLNIIYGHFINFLGIAKFTIKKFLTSDFLIKYLTVATFASYLMTFVIFFGSRRVQKNVFVKNSHHRTLFAFLLSLVSYLIVPTHNLPITHLMGVRIGLKILMYNLLINFLLQASLSC